MGPIDAVPITNLLPLMDQKKKFSFEHYAGYELWDAVYPFSMCLAGGSYKLQAPIPHTAAPPYLEILKDSYDKSTDLRSLTLTITYKGNEWSTFRFKEDLHSWSITPKLPPVHDNNYIVRHVGGELSRSYNVTLVFKGPSSVTLNITATHFGRTPVLDEIIQSLPDWTDTAAFITTFSTWVL